MHGAVHQQYSNPINVKISQFGIEVIRGFPERMAPYFGGEAAQDLGFREHGHLYCCSTDGVESARARRSAAQSRRPYRVP